MELEYFYIKVILSLIGLLCFVFLLMQSDLKNERRRSSLDNNSRLGKEVLFDVPKNDTDNGRFIDIRYEVDMAKKSHAKLAFVREDISLLEQVSFRDVPGEDRTFERLRLCIAIYNDFRSSDFEIVKQLFIEAIKWRKSQVPGDPDHIYFCAYLLSLFEKPEIIWLFDQAKNIDFDSNCGFDDEHYLSFGVQNTIQYLKSQNDEKSVQMLKGIGGREENGLFSQAEIDEWKKGKECNFSAYRYPIHDELSQKTQ